MPWVKFHSELCKGAKRGLPRATRFVFMELALESRPGRGVLYLAPGMSDDESVHDLLGGNRAEVRAALAALQKPPYEMIRFEDRVAGRVLVIPAWQTWNTIDETAKDRQRRHRSKDDGHGALSNKVTPLDTDVSRVTDGGVTSLEERRGEETREEEITEAPKGGRKRRGSRLPETWAPSQALLDWSHARGVDGAEHVEDFRNFWLAAAGKAATKVDWDRTFQNRIIELIRQGRAVAWVPSDSTKGAGPKLEGEPADAAYVEAAMKQIEANLASRVRS